MDLTHLPGFPSFPIHAALEPPVYVNRLRWILICLQNSVFDVALPPGHHPFSTGAPHLWDADRASVHVHLAPHGQTSPVQEGCLEVMQARTMSSICSMSCFGQMMIKIMSAHKIDNNTCERPSSFLTKISIEKVGLSSVAQSYLTLSTPWIAARQASLSITNSESLLKLMSIGDAFQPSHPLSCPSPPALNLSQHQGLFK